MDQAGSIIANNGLVGVLTRFNFWLKEFKSWDVEDMAKHCGGDVGTLVSWPEVKYYIVGDVERTSGTTCVKPGVSKFKRTMLLAKPSHNRLDIQCCWVGMNLREELP